jgi:phage-related protein
MGLAELRQKLAEKLKERAQATKEAVERNEARDDYETTDKALRNMRRDVRREMDKDEKEQLRKYLRARAAQEDRSWLNPYGMLDTQDSNLSRPQVNVFRNNDNAFELNQKQQVGNILSVPNSFKQTNNTKRKNR